MDQELEKWLDLAFEDMMKEVEQREREMQVGFWPDVFPTGMIEDDLPDLPA